MSCHRKIRGCRSCWLGHGCLSESVIEKKQQPVFGNIGFNRQNTARHMICVQQQQTSRTMLDRQERIKYIAPGKDRNSGNKRHFVARRRDVRRQLS